MRKRFRQDSRGASTEYALILAIVGVALGGAAPALGCNVSLAVHDAADEIHDLNAAPDS